MYLIPPYPIFTNICNDDVNSFSSFFRSFIFSYRVFFVIKTAYISGQDCILVTRHPNVTYRHSDIRVTTECMSSDHSHLSHEQRINYKSGLKSCVNE